MAPFHGRRSIQARHVAPMVALMLVTVLLVAGLSPGLPGQDRDRTATHGPVKLDAIEFPEWTDLSGLTTVPPGSAPLAQQVVFRFSGVPDVPLVTTISAPPGYDHLQIYATLPVDYTGPEAAVDWARNVIPARGTYERIGKTIVFTPSFPLESIDLSASAPLPAVPGLLPDMEYTIFVPLGGIPNLTAIDPAVQNPVLFTTIREEMPALFYSNHRARAPEATATWPADGALDAPVNTLSGSIPGFPPEEEFAVAFDEPLLAIPRNIEGRDIDGDGVLEQNLFLGYHQPVLFGACETGPGGVPAIVRIDRRSGADTLVGETRLATPPYQPVALKGIVLKRDGTLLGTSGDTLYDVEFRDLAHPGLCRVGKARALAGLSDVRGLAVAPRGALCAVDGSTGDILIIDEKTGGVTILASLGGAHGTLFDLAIRADGTGFATAVTGSGTPSARTTLLEIDPATGIGTVIWSGTADYTSISMAGFSRLSCHGPSSLSVDLFDIAAGAFVPAGAYTIAGTVLPVGAAFDFCNIIAELGLHPRVTENSWHGSRVVLDPAGILPFGESVEIMMRRSLASISFGSRARLHGAHAAEADLLATFTTFDPGAPAVQDALTELFLDNEGEAEPVEYEGLPAASWNVQDSDGVPPDYEHLLAAHGLSGGGGLGDFVPTGFLPTLYLDTDVQKLPLPDGSTPGVLVPTVVRGGVFNFRDIAIPAGVTVVGVGSNPLVLTATGTIEVAGAIDVSGEKGENDVTFDTAFIPTKGGRGGAGGGRGGVSHPLVPEDYKALTDLRSPTKAEDGAANPHVFRYGGRGGFTGADGTSVRYRGGVSGSDNSSRGSGGGGGSFLQEGGKGYHGLGRYGADPSDPNRYFLRGTWNWYDGHPNPVPGVNQYATEHSPGGDPGPLLFRDGTTANDFIGRKGEIPFLIGGQGGGGGGSRLDSMNPATIPLAAGWNPPVDRSAYDAKGGGGGGGGGAIGLYALGEIAIRSTGALLAFGGDGGGGEVIGHSNYGGGGGGGSGGAIILDSAVRIRVEQDALIDVSGGWPADAKENAKYTTSEVYGNPCLNPRTGGGFNNFHKATYCAWSVGDGGFGGHGLVQLQVPDWKTGLVVDDPSSIRARLCEVDWLGAEGFCDYTLGQVHCGCNSSSHCEQKYYHYKVHYPAPSQPEFPVLSPKPAQSKWAPAIDPALTPSAVGSLSYGLSGWIDCGQVVFRPDVGGFPAPHYTGFAGIDAFGQVITVNGHIPNPGQNDIVVDAPDLGLTDYIPDSNRVLVLFQGANSPLPGSATPDPATLTPWTAAIESLSGCRFVRFRVCFDTAFGVPLTAASPKPQVNMVRIRVEY